MCIMPLGGGQEVGRSSILLQFRGRNIMLDCGSHPGREGNDSLPFFDSLDDPGDIDLILITHFHIDHCAALPYFTEKTNFKGRIFMTHATKAVMKMLLSDNIKLQTRSRPLYSESELQSCVDKIEVVDYHQTIEHRGEKRVSRFCTQLHNYLTRCCLYLHFIPPVMYYTQF
jgi:cleavage and polyadenylation specificity factor subunit 3